MSHDLEVWEDGSASFVSAREHAWHRLGTVVPQQFDAAQAMQYAKLGGWNVRLVGVADRARAGRQRRDPGAGRPGPVRHGPGPTR